jgi:hypothetical protein
MAFALATSRKALQVACKATGKKAAAKVRMALLILANTDISLDLDAIIRLASDTSRV